MCFLLLVFFLPDACFPGYTCMLDWVKMIPDELPVCLFGFALLMILSRIPWEASPFLVTICEFDGIKDGP